MSGFLHRHDKHGKAFASATIQLALCDIADDRPGCIRELKRAKRALERILRDETAAARKLKK